MATDYKWMKKLLPPHWSEFIHEIIISTFSLILLILTFALIDFLMELFNYENALRPLITIFDAFKVVSFTLVLVIFLHKLIKYFKK